VCGRVCAAPCEDRCRRGKFDAPVAIRALKRFVTERFGVESREPDTLAVLSGGTAAEPGRGYHVNYIGIAPLPEPAVAFCVRVTNEPSSPAVTAAAREVTRRLLSGLAARLTRPSWPAARRGPAPAPGPSR